MSTKITAIAKTAAIMVQYSLLRAYCSEQQLAIVCLPLGISVPGGFFN